MEAQREPACRLTPDMRAAHARIQKLLPAEKFEAQMISFAGEIAGVCSSRQCSPRKAAIYMHKYATKRGDKVVADKVFAALVWWAESEAR